QGKEKGPLLSQACNLLSPLLSKATLCDSSDLLGCLEENQWQEDQYDHLDAADMTKVEKSTNEAMEWMNNKLNLQKKQSLTVEPVVKGRDTEAKIKELTNICSPIISKPKPKVEPPKEE
ncbi:Heat Shock 70 Kda Protein 4, partial [Manis pentadactyla]